MSTALRNELSRLCHDNVAGGSVDIFKCFDQINRPLLYRVALKACMPRRVLDPYFNYIDNLKIRYQVGKTIGKEHQDRCSIPQGCPFSMTMVALMLQPWIKLINQEDVVPRVLADDLMFTATGEGHRAKTVKAMRISMQFFEDIGARVATNKCFTFATDLYTRTYLANLNWDNKGTKIPNINSFRDLGGHLNLNKNLNGATLTARMYKAAQMAKRLRWMPIPRKFKETIVLCNIIPAGLYGAESAHVNQSALKHLKSAIAYAIGPSSAKRCVDLVFASTQSAKDLDPEAHILFQRIAAIRRIMAKDAEFPSIVVDIIHHLELYIKGRRAQAKANNSRNIWHNPDDEGDSDDPVQFGPVGMLIHQLAAYDHSIDTSLIIKGPNEAEIDVWNMPWQHLKTAVMGIVQRHRTKRIDEHRTFVGTITEIDDNLHKKVIHHLGTAEQKIHMHISTGGFWAEIQNDAINSTGTQCQHCGQEVTGPEHVLWRCPCINKHRKHREMCEVDPNDLPKSILNGLPPAMSSRIHSFFWDKEDKPFQHGDTKHVAFGMPKNKFHSNLMQSDQMLLDALLDKLGIGHYEINARQAFTQLKKDNASDTIMPLPYKCVRDAPEQINVYTDGSWLFPLKQFLGLGGTGVWWPRRSLDRENCDRRYYLPLSEAERALAQHEQREDGLRIYSRIGGYAGSSTRTELAAGIIGLSAHGPVHIGSDSRAFVDTANKYINLINRKARIKKPWKLISDGDLWQHFYEAVQAKGTNAIRITWVKGHATEEHIKKRITNEQDKIGNDVADKCADIGTALHGEDLIKLSKIMQRRHNKYLNFMKEVSHHIVEAYMIHRRLLQLRAKQQSSSDDEAKAKITFEPLTYANASDAKPLTIAGTVAHFKKFYNLNPNAKHAEYFLRDIKIKPSQEGIRPLTWLELYILFRLRGHPKPVKDPPSKADARPTPAKQIAAFKKTIRAVAHRTLAPDVYKATFSSANIRKANLTGVAIAGKHASVPFNVYATSREVKEIATLLVKLNHTISGKNIDLFLSGELKLRVNDLNLKGKAKWDCDIRTLEKTPDIDRNSLSLANKRTLEIQTGNGQLSFNACPKCMHKEANSVTQFQINDLDVKLKCVKCLKATPVRYWTCDCNKQWHMCPLHGDNSALCETANAKSNIKVPKRPEVKRVAYPPVVNKTDGEHALLLSGDLRIERKRKAAWLTEEEAMGSELILGIGYHNRIPPGFLGPILKKRFNRAEQV